MSEIDVETQPDSVREFVLSLPQDPDGTALRVNGKTLFRVVPVPSTTAGDWSEKSNARRCLLIEKELRGSISPTETIELENLQEELRRHRRLVVPLPLGETRRILEELERKAGG